MIRRRLLQGIGVGLSPWGSVLASPGLPSVLGRPAATSRLAPSAALLTAARAGRRLLLAGERGIVLWSDDQGQQWTQASVPVQLSLTALGFVNEREGWAAGHFGALLRTQDAGQTWTLVMDGGRAAQLLSQAAADDAQRRMAQRQIEQGADKPFFDLALAEGRLLAVGAYGLALQGRADGSEGFTALGARLNNPRQLHLYAVRAAGSRVYIAGEQGLLLRSVDGGASFEPLPSPYKGSFFGLLLLGDSTVLAYGLRGNIWRSPDHGQSWQQVANPLPVSLGAGIALSDGSVVLLAQNGDLLVSRNQGQSFERRPAAQPFPAATLVAAADERQLVLGGLRGIHRQALS